MIAKAETYVDNVVTTSVAIQMDPIEHFFKGCEFSLIVEVQTWKSTATRYQNEVKRAQEHASKAKFEYVECIDILRLRHAKQ